MTGPLTIPALLSAGERRFGHRPAVVDGEDTLSYAELAARARHAARSHLAIGVRPGDRVAIWAPNGTEFIVALLGAQLIGAAVVPLNTRYRGQEARHILAHSRAGALVVAGDFLGADRVQLLIDSAGPDAGTTGPIPGLPDLHTVVDVGTTPRADTLSWPDFLARGATVPDTDLAAATEAVTPDTVCDILYTSGTTGLPKGVMSGHRQTLGVAHVWARGAELTETDRYAVVNPFFHSFGYKAGLLTSLTAGTAIYPLATFDAEQLLQLVEAERITVLPGPPTIFTTLINHPRLPHHDLSSLRYAVAGATSVPANLFEQMIDVLGIDRVAQPYGLTECVVATHSRADDDPRHIAECCGPAVDGIEVRIVDTGGHDLPAGSDGEVLLRGENVMLGYLDDPAATADAIDSGGWLHTGDVGRLDEHGCLTITDRLKDMIVVGGFNVYPAEVENVLSTHPDVVEAAVVGIPDDRLGSVPRAYLVARAGVTVDEDATIAWCRERLANFKVPREVIALTELPRNASGKVLKRELTGPA
ncbi:FadD3 family acyl-CoA ligase [Prauserella halophila]|uniref:FadD3 family acyl-CoA ligase n=1 Tax=Prauserella halophila TaxID=185641 RepID=A0ABN1W2I1_9PSEU|nr:AMP-binding protein [Prauserella halophila]MCP2237404.1 Acyl-CoA synthetase (AMP-forming)/AMP-acid ligase II [Prauserella halophila]